VNFEIPKMPDADGLKQLEKMEKVQHTYILWITEGTAESITAEVEAFVEKLYRTGAIAKARPPKPKERGEEGRPGQGRRKKEEKKDDARDAAGDEPKKKDKEKSKVMKMIEDDDDDKKDEKKGEKKDE